jgi:hypothetical protein
MLLTDPEIQNALETAKAAFPHFSDWEYQNETGGDYFGFSMWGREHLKVAKTVKKRVVH